MNRRGLFVDFTRAHRTVRPRFVYMPSQVASKGLLAAAFALFKGASQAKNSANSNGIFHQFREETRWLSGAKQRRNGETLLGIAYSEILRHTPAPKGEMRNEKTALHD